MIFSNFGNQFVNKRVFLACSGKINRQKEIIGTEVNENGELIDSKPILLEFPSINILKSESGGGIIYWNGNEFEYIHQSC